MRQGYEDRLQCWLESASTYFNRTFLIDYINLLQSISDAPVEFHLMASLFILSTVTAQRFTFASAIDSPLFSTKRKGTQGRKLNLFVIIFGKSRISRKTSAVMKKIEEIVKELNINQVSDVWSTPHLISQLSEMVKNDSVHAVWVLDECSLFFDLISKSNSYLADAEAALSKLYDGNTYSSGTQSRGREYVPNPHFSVFLASTESLPAKFKKNAFEQGFYNRYIFTPGRRRNRKNLKAMLTEDQKQKALIILEYLKTIQRLNHHTNIIMSDEAQAIYQKFEDRIEKMIEANNLGFKEGYYGGIPNTVTKIACLFRINRLTKDSLKSENFGSILAIERQDMEMAVKFGRLILYWFEQMIELRTKHSNKGKKVETTEEVIALILSVYKKHQERELSQSILRRQTKLFTNDLIEGLKTIADDRKGESTGGKPPTLWKLHDDIKL